MTVDWNKPIICKENGARLEVVEGPDRDGNRKCKPVGQHTWPNTRDSGTYWFRANGSFLYDVQDITVINAPEADIPHSAKVRACELANAEPDVRGFAPEHLVTNGPLRALARYIAQHEPEPVDPDLVLAREAAAASYEGGDLFVLSAAIREGKSDEAAVVQSALRAIKLVRERGGAQA